CQLYAQIIEDDRLFEYRQSTLVSLHYLGNALHHSRNIGTHRLQRLLDRIAHAVGEFLQERGSFPQSRKRIRGERHSRSPEGSRGVRLENLERHLTGNEDAL